MFAYLKYCKSKKSCLNTIDRINEEYRNNSKTNGLSSFENANIKRNYLVDLDIAYDDLAWVETSYLQCKSRALNIPIPSDWFTESYDLNRILSPQYQYELLKRIREERRARREPFLAWAGWIVGIIGATTGLVAVLMK